MEIRHSQTDAEREQAARLAAETFSPQNVEAAVHFWLHALPHEPSYDPQHLRIISIGDQVVSFLHIVDREMQVGRARLKVGGIGKVVTAPAHRGQGYSSALLRSTLDFMTSRGFDLTSLDGIPDYYPRFGYATVMPYRRVEFQVHEALALPASLSARPIALDDVPALMALYESEWGGRVGAFVRNEARWRWCLHGPQPGVVAVDGGDWVRGYATPDVHLGWVGEAAATDVAAVATLLHHLAERAQEKGQDVFSINLPGDSAFVRMARALCWVQVVEHSRPGAGWQARLLNVETALSKLVPELSARLARSFQSGWRGALRLETESGGATLEIPNGEGHADTRASAPLICRLPQARLTQLLFGYLTIDEIAALPETEIPQAAAPVLAVLFSPQVAHLGGQDWF